MTGPHNGNLLVKPYTYTNACFEVWSTWLLRIFDRGALFCDETRPRHGSFIHGWPESFIATRVTFSAFSGGTVASGLDARQQDVSFPRDTPGQ
jgi:hypothetical protein